MDILKELTKLDFTFTGSAMNVMLEHYAIRFTNSNVNDHLIKLNKVKNKIEQSKTQGIYITVDEVNSIIKTYTNLINEYLRINDFDSIPKNLKLYQLKKDLIEFHNGKLESLKGNTNNEEMNTNKEDRINEITKEILNKILNPTSPKPLKLTKKRQLEANADQKTAQRNLKNIQKLSLN